MFHRTAGLVVTLIASVLAAQPVPATAAKPVARDVEVTLTGPGEPTDDGHWCIGDGVVHLTAHVLDVVSQTELTAGWVAWEMCQSAKGYNRQIVPKEDCEEGGAPGTRVGWEATGYNELPNAIFTLDPEEPLFVGFRVHFQPERIGGFDKGETSEAFNLDSTCPPAP